MGDAEYLDGLRRELDYYERLGKNDRADEVRAELRRLGEDVPGKREAKESASTGRKTTARGRKTTER